MNAKDARQLGLDLRQDFQTWSDRLLPDLVSLDRLQEDCQTMATLEDIAALDGMESPWMELYQALTEDFLPCSETRTVAEVQPGDFPPRPPKQPQQDGYDRPLVQPDQPLVPTRSSPSPQTSALPIPLPSQPAPATGNPSGGENLRHQAHNPLVRALPVPPPARPLEPQLGDRPNHQPTRPLVQRLPVPAQSAQSSAHQISSPSSLPAFNAEPTDGRSLKSLRDLASLMDTLSANDWIGEDHPATVQQEPPTDPGTSVRPNRLPPPTILLDPHDTPSGYWDAAEPTSSLPLTQLPDPPDPSHPAATTSPGDRSQNHAFSIPDSPSPSSGATSGEVLPRSSARPSPSSGATSGEVLLPLPHPPFPFTDFPLAPLPDLDIVLDALRQEVNREYRRFYGSE